MPKDRTIRPTEREMEILEVLWDKGPLTVREVHETLIPGQDVGYTTTLRLMQIMHEKGILSRNEKNRSHVYTPLLKKETVQKQVVGKMIRNLFKGSPAKLVMHALGNYNATPEEIKQITAYIEEMKKNKKASS